MKLIYDKLKPPLGGVLAAEYVKSIKNIPIEIQWGNETLVDNGTQKISCSTNNDLLRAIARSAAESELYGQSPLEKTEVDHWLTFSIGPLQSNKGFNEALTSLDKLLGPVTFLACKRLTIADFAVFSVLHVSKQWEDLVSKKQAPVNVVRWYSFLKSHPFIIKALQSLPDEVKTLLTPSSQSKTNSNVGNRAREGKFVDLPGAEMGKVVVRFPPEASGYLHIGHAKAALLNQYYQEMFQGKLVMRFDDTNPAKENVHFEKVILEDVALLEIKPDVFTHTSQYFDLMLEYCEKLLKEEKAYVDDTDPEVMKTQREQKIESVNRNNSYEQNLKLWEEMKKGTEKGQQCCVRAKIDMQSPNGCLRDPTIYRCKNEPHPRTGDKYKVYPTYDFACPIVDAIEGVTHTLRTMEYHDRDPQFYWFIEALGLRKPYIWEYSRLSMTNTVLSKRKLTWFVNEGLVDGWDDPRMPTVRGVLRRGMTVQGLKEFIIAQGSSRSVVFMEWDKIWAFNKKVIDPIAPRLTALEHNGPVTVNVKGVKEECLTVPKHPKNSEVGNKSVWIGPQIVIDRVDADSLKEGENATFINWGNLLIKKINRDSKGVITSIDADPNLENKDYKKTLKLTWLAVTDSAKFTPTWCVYFDHIINKPLLGKDEDFKQFIGHETRKEVQMIGDPELKKLKKGDIIQLQRRGFFRVDVAYEPLSLYTCKEQPIILFYIPDGHTKENPVASVSKTATSVSKTATSVSKTAATSTNKVPTVQRKSSNKTESELSDAINKQGDLVRKLKAEKAGKPEIDKEVKALLQLKEEFKKVCGKEWKPGVEVNTVSPPSQTDGLLEAIARQGDLVRKLKAEKANKTDVDREVKVLLQLKDNFKTMSGKEWKPDLKPSSQVNKASPPPPSSGDRVVSPIKTEAELLDAISRQGDQVRQLKAVKASKAEIDREVKILLQLKDDFKKVAGKEWKPDLKANTQASNVSIGNIIVSPNKTEAELLESISKQGDLVRKLKAVKASKADIDREVKILLQLKGDFKNLTGTDWKPDLKASAQVNNVSPPPPSSGDIIVSPNKTKAELLETLSKQRDLVRKLKADADREAKILLQLEEDFKKVDGEECKSEVSVVRPILPTLDELVAKITEQGNLVRDLKGKKSSKEEIDGAVRNLLGLKASYKNATGNDFPADGRTPSKPKVEKVAKQKQEVKDKKPVNVEETGLKKQTRLGLEAKKEDNLSEWYSQVITKSEMIDYYNVSGCYILRPWSYSIWESIKDWFDGEIKKLGVKNCMFPLFVSQSVLEKEKAHIADFAPEVAWVTKSGDSELAEPIAIRPTSETVMYPAYAKWIQSHRQLPIKLNQWNNVVRWEFKHPQPFLRTREFLWQEGHTAYAVKAEAEKEVKVILDLYAKIYSDLLAVPVVKGRKTEKEKFAGGEYTLTIEAFISSSGRAIQAATSHHLGQNFSKMFDIIFEDPESQEKNYVYQNSWGITTRSVGVMTMVHSDNQGLVLPPRVANIQVILVPCGITAGLSEQARAHLQASCDALESDLRKTGIRVEGDYRNYYSPGWKFNHWELKGVPIRVELGPKDIEKKQVVAVRRDSAEKITLPRDSAVEKIVKLLEDIQNDLYRKAEKELKTHVVTLKDWSQFSAVLDTKNLILAPFCGDSSCEDKIKADSTRDEAVEPGAPSMGAKSLCIPLEQPAPIQDKDKCIHPDCKRKPLYYTLFGRSY